MSEESNANGDNAGKRKLDSPDSAIDKKKVCTAGCKTAQEVLMNYRTTLTPKPERYQGVVTLKVPITMAENKWLEGQPVSIGGFDWRVWVRVYEDCITCDIQCNENDNSPIWMSKASCEMGFLDNNGTLIHGSVKTGIFTANNICKSFKAPEKWSSVIKNSSLITDGFITVHATVNLINDAGVRMPHMNIFSSPSEYSDVVLLVEEKRFHVSKSILALQSPFFHSLFYSGFTEKNQDEIELTDVDPEEFEDLLNVIYPSAHLIESTKVAREFYENYEHLLKLADMFQVNTVLKVCEDFLSDEDRCCIMDNLKLADKYRLPRVVAECVSTLCNVDAIKAFTKKTGFKSLSLASQMEFYQKLAQF